MSNTSSNNYQLSSNEMTFTFMPSGDIREITVLNRMINQWVANPVDGSLNNLYLRLHTANGIEAIPMIGIHSTSKMSHSDSQIIWTGTARELKYQVTFTLTDQHIWFWDVKVEGRGQEIDVIYGQDLGIADKGVVRTNEAYLSQYIDHTVFEDTALGYVVCSRQNQPQQGEFPYIQQGSLTKAAGYSTDGYQFFGLSYKESDQAAVLTQASLANEVYQYEFAYTALQSERVRLDGSSQFVFYGLYRPNHPHAITELEFSNELKQAWAQASKIQAMEAAQPVHKASFASAIGTPLLTESMTIEEVKNLFPNREQEEWQGEELLSFFTDTYEHVVLKAKELLIERPHGHILMTGNNDRLNDQILTTTSYMYGIFNSQLVLGNTSSNKMLTNARNALNVMKTSGQRIYIEQSGEYRLLTMPSMFEMGFNYARWYYKMQDDMLIITNFTTVDTPEVHLQVRSTSGKAYTFMVTNQVSMNNNEYLVPFHMNQEADVLTFRADAESDSASVLPELNYRMKVFGTELAIQDETALVSGIAAGSASLVVLKLNACKEWSMTVRGALHNEQSPILHANAENEIERYREYYRKVMNGFHLSIAEGTSDNLQKVNAIAWWYTHNMLVHYSVPHGLEQYGGAAWGTRDVCQGPTEYFMAMQKYDRVRDILKQVYSHQYEDDGNWPQWFMFDQYYKIQQEESHGDIIVWPLKVLGDYLHNTHDYSILEELLPYTNRHTAEFTDAKYSLADHAKKEIAYIKNHFLHDTHLSAYGDGDWDDTLQPANAQLKQYMISSWTVALTYQTLSQLSSVLAEKDSALSTELQELAAGIQKDFNQYMLQTDVIPGFVYMEEPGKAEYMLHPTDTTTGIQYRLLPMTRSMIAELLTKEQADAHYELIKKELYCPDGVRLMNKPAKYVGGVSTHFKRAEQASNFGREVGLQYVHAHIRFVEAMAKLGKSEETWKGLEMINPVGIQSIVPNAELRQSNAYFSSSDGKFNTRYEAQERFDELRTGKVAVKGGWRIYSSGPGIYLNQLISNCLGIRHEGQDLILDPVLPQTCDGMQFDYELNGQKVRFIYRITGQPIQGVTINGYETKFIPVPNPYRQGGIRIEEQELCRLMNLESNELLIQL
ncbi:cellobiose phosphorylase [Paenibacillus albiflavus]|uniref:Cellobiose phosphorylase n=1 Tax=Paenibacillus albiflavus TaxID=2545760 RepID=A0A4R4E8C3_9BACL|nr:cellobiose phosphorylase [Paenibacillus albiflavus]TCZ75799.1 cellobiose phosphorylase [Paenibacillus albiflavus]